MKPFILKQHTLQANTIRELQSTELNAVSGACSPEPTLPTVTITGHSDGSASYDDGDE